ncbi:MAG TPA: hypothetical protein VNK48_14535 [Xanthobacteraceae bacterium]|nr:hypothetical protein [Xanthobacteraceae bacterium]
MASIPATLCRLSALSPGEAIVYYRGHFHDDIRRSLPGATTGEGAPKYAELLMTIEATAKRMAAEGRVKLSARRAQRAKGRIKAEFFEYVAEGIGEGS